MKSIILVLVAVLILGAGGWYYYTNIMPDPDTEHEEMMEEMDAMMENGEMMEHEGEEASAVTPTGKVIDITYTDKGFDPITFDASLGDTLKFANKSTKEFWPATGPHENHGSGGFAEFDSQEGIKIGESYEIVMSKAGVWEFHNHFNEDHEGTVTVK